jgi:hypothetical protein
MRCVILERERQSSWGTHHSQPEAVEVH